MKRRSFFKVAGLLGLSSTVLLANETKEKIKGIYYTAKNPLRWAGKSGSHSPIITQTGEKITVETKHGMSEFHYIVKHTLSTIDGTVIGEQVFFPNMDKVAISQYQVKLPKGTKIYATSFCNLHDLWVSEFTTK